MSKSKLLLGLLVFTFLLGSLAFPAPTEITSCQYLPPGEYILANDLVIPEGQACFEINESGSWVIDLNNHSIILNDYSYLFNITNGYLERNITLMNGTIYTNVTDFDVYLATDRTTYDNFYNLTLNTSSPGLGLRLTSYYTLLNNIRLENSIAVKNTYWDSNMTLINVTLGPGSQSDLDAGRIKRIVNSYLFTVISKYGVHEIINSSIDNVLNIWVPDYCPEISNSYFGGLPIVKVVGNQTVDITNTKMIFACNITSEFNVSTDVEDIYIICANCNSTINLNNIFVYRAITAYGDENSTVTVRGMGNSQTYIVGVYGNMTLVTKDVLINYPIYIGHVGPSEQAPKLHVINDSDRTNVVWIGKTVIFGYVIDNINITTIKHPKPGSQEINRTVYNASQDLVIFEDRLEGFYGSEPAKYEYQIGGLLPNSYYTVYRNGAILGTYESSSTGTITFDIDYTSSDVGQPNNITITKGVPPVTEITSCQYLPPGEYILANDLVIPEGQACFEINGTGNWTIDLNGHEIIMNEESKMFNITDHSEVGKRIVVKNGNIYVNTTRWVEGFLTDPVEVVELTNLYLNTSKTSLTLDIRKTIKLNVTNVVLFNSFSIVSYESGSAYLINVTIEPGTEGRFTLNRAKEIVNTSVYDIISKFSPELIENSNMTYTLNVIIPDYCPEIINSYADGKPIVKIVGSDSGEFNDTRVVFMCNTTSQSIILKGYEGILHDVHVSCVGTCNSSVQVKSTTIDRIKMYSQTSDSIVRFYGTDGSSVTFASSRGNGTLVIENMSIDIGLVGSLLYPSTSKLYVINDTDNNVRMLYGGGSTVFGYVVNNINITTINDLPSTEECHESFNRTVYEASPSLVMFDDKLYWYWESPEVTPYTYVVSGLNPSSTYNVYRNGTLLGTYSTDDEGRLTFNINYTASDEDLPNNITIEYVPPDTTPPTVNIIKPEPTVYCTGTIPLEYTVYDESGVDKCWYYLDGNGPYDLPNCENTTLAITTSGSHTVEVYANDTYGNVGSDSVTFTVDLDNPTVTLISPENKSYNVQDVPLEFTASDPTTSISACYYSLDGEAYQSIPCSNTTLTDLPEGTHHLVFKVEDECGHSAEDEVYFTIDLTAPTVQIISPENKSYNVQNIPLEYVVQDGVVACWYELDGTTYDLPGCENTTLTVSEGNHHLIVYANDSAGNVGSDEVYFSVDLTPPTTDYTVSGTFGPRGWLLSDANITLTCSDNLSGCYKTYYCVDTTNTCTPTTEYTEPIVITNEGKNYVRFYSVDNAGNEETVKSAEIDIDKTPPITTIEIIGRSYNGYYLPNVTVRLTCSDDVSGCYATYYCVDNNNTCTPTTEYTEEFILTEGDWYVRYYSEDVAGNTENVNSYHVVVRTAPPYRAWIGIVPIMAAAGYILMLVKMAIESGESSFMETTLKFIVLAIFAIIGALMIGYLFTTFV